MAGVELSGLIKSYGALDVVHGIDLSIEDGQFTVLVGPSGCGKSTTLRMIAGLEEISGGTISFDGNVMNDLPPKERDIAMVFQSYALYPNMTVGGNMAFGLKMKGVPKPDRETAVREAAELLGITELLGRRPRTLSGGQRQRVAMGRAMVRRPAVFLFDEPLSNLDAALRTKMRLEIKKIHQRLRTTMIYVTHDQIEAMTLADRIVVMNRGIIEQVGSPQELYAQPVNRFVASFIGSPAMNMLPGKLLESGSGLVAELACGVSLNIPADRVPAYRGMIGRDIEVGLRPEHLTDEPQASGPNAEFFDVTVDVVEPIGACSLISFMHDGNEYIAQGQPLVTRQPGEQQRLQAAMDHMHLIDVATGLVVPHKASSTDTGVVASSPHPASDESATPSGASLNLEKEIQ
tara:strand:- start:185094 stop:186305 length:1212 start_codon:yes stop_codon:yes gene_type:complete